MMSECIYFAEHGERQFWWTYANDVKENLAEEERRQLVFTKGRSERWRPEGRWEFMAVA